MGRILEALLQASQRRSKGEKAGSSHSYPAGREQPEVLENTAEVPFIEVGGPGSLVEGSANVLSLAPRGGRNVTVIKHAATEPRPLGMPRTPSKVTTPGGDPLAVTFCPVSEGPLPAQPAPMRFAPQLIAFHDPDHSLSDQYRSLVNGMLAQLPPEGSQILLLAGTKSGTGTTTVLLNLAITLAKQNQRVLAVDANLRRPAIAEQLGLSENPGLRDVVARTVLWKRAFKETGQSNFYVLTAGDGNTQKRDWPAGDALRGTLHQLRNHFDWILVDVPSWDSGPEMVSLSSAC
ncbi:MAG TPA: cellulose synthase operon protein YhjQ/BcsQ, partial [Gemmataceae bacterium]|nr:cellulose synthase operon protein YhjQ/BcsQ [Gemmataceae bacterium]